MKSLALFSTLLLALFLSLFAACSDDSSSSPTGTGEAVESSVSQDGKNSATSSSATSKDETSSSSATSASKSRGKTLVAYFSRTGNTKPLAEYAAEYLDATLFEITAKIPYTDEDIAYYTDCRADREQKDESARPEIATVVKNMDEYDTVIIAHPIWHGIAPRIISTFLEGYDFSGKTLLTFCTSASSPLGQSAKLLQELTPNSTWLESKRFAIGTSREEIEEWLEDVLRP
ncbi:Flavodoxin [Fibrobacter sp. UWT2]|uniref:flavodoxin n=1 Tax=Fibrobacter sp. UWT2 TaxID=1896224 RepID=UPI00091507B7|nr:flavodoxin [Fibrobacter sp. UWT2]SHK37452.1 Flavodoxin [Fibrobacter sp. UWT2]